MQAVAAWNLTELPDAEVCQGTGTVGLWYLPEESALFAAASSGDLLLLEPESGGHEVVSTWLQGLPHCISLHNDVPELSRGLCCMKASSLCHLMHSAFLWVGRCADQLLLGIGKVQQGSTLGPGPLLSGRRDVLCPASTQRACQVS